MFGNAGKALKFKQYPYQRVIFQKKYIFEYL